MWECMILCKSFQSASTTTPTKEQDKDDEDDKKDRDGFQQQQNVVNVIFGGDSSFSKRAQKLLLREILSVEPAIQRPLKYSEVPITFSREDQWTKKVLASTRSSRSGLQAYSSTNRRQKWAQPNLCKHTGKDGPQLYESA